MVDVRTFRLGDGRWAVAVRGDLDRDGAVTIADEVRECTGAPVVLDLRHVRLAESRALDTLVSTVCATFVADRPLRDALAQHPVAVAPDLRTAFERL